MGIQHTQTRTHLLNQSFVQLTLNPFLRCWLLHQEGVRDPELHRVQYRRYDDHHDNQFQLGLAVEHIEYIRQDQVQRCDELVHNVQCADLRHGDDRHPYNQLWKPDTQLWRCSVLSEIHCGAIRKQLQHACFEAFQEQNVEESAESRVCDVRHAVPLALVGVLDASGDENGQEDVGEMAIT